MPSAAPRAPCSRRFSTRPCGRLGYRFPAHEPEWEFVPEEWTRPRTPRVRVGVRTGGLHEGTHDPRVRWNVDAVAERSRLLWLKWKDR
jgi:hypothetical protein